MTTRLLHIFTFLAIGLPVLVAFPGCPGRSYEVKQHAGTCNYFPSGLMLKYDQAKAYCKRKYGEQATLPSILNEEDNLFYSSYLAGMGWIGLVRDSDKGAYKWEDGSTSAYRNWNVSNPKVGHRCAYMVDRMNWDQGKWFSFPCNQQARRIMCKSGVVNNWRVFNDFEYYAQLQTWKNITWEDARQECMKIGADLLSIQTHDQWKKINQWLKESSPDLGEKRLWIGMKTTEGNNWKWSDGARPILKYWETSYPIDTLSGAKCVVMTREGVWMNTNCGIKQNGYLCKRPKGSNVPMTAAPVPATPGYCPAGYDLLRGKCFRVILSETAKWEDALRRCQKEPGLSPDLASIRGKMDTAYLASRLSGREVWMGGTRQVEGRWGWTDGSTAGEFNYFGPTIGQGDCMRLGEKGVELGRWTADLCNQTKGFVCQTHKDPNNPIATAGPQVITCPTHYEVYKHVCYRLVEEKLNWTQAYTTCKKDDAALISIENEAENSAVYTQVLKLQETSNTTVRLWIGFQDLENTGSYGWIDGNWANFTRWTRNEPRRKVNGGCVAFREGSLYQETGIWEDKECFRLYPTICKRGKVTNTSSGSSRRVPFTDKLSVLAAIVTVTAWGYRSSFMWNY